jgi:predicted nucleic acid-binding protein
VILLDTNVISELVRPLPDPAVVSFVSRQAPDAVFTSAICEAEIHYGLARLPPGRRRDDLTARITAFLATGFPTRVLRFDSACAVLYGKIRADREAAGKPISVEDGMIAATARAHSAMVVTRNLTDFRDCGIDIVSPWDAVGPAR